MTSPDRVIHGYPSLAAFIASDKDQSASIYRAHRRISARNLLYLETELSELEAELDALDQEDLNGSFEGKKYARSWKLLRESPNARHVEEVKLITKMRETVKEYHDALIREEAIARMGRPHRHTVQTLDKWTRKNSKEGTSILMDRGSARLDDEDDLVALRIPEDQDYLIRFVRRYLRVFFLEGDVESNLAYISERKIVRAVSIFSMFIAAILLVGAVVNLYLVQNNNVRLGLIGGYTAAFALSLGVLTNARRTELYGSTAAYAAVLVVFVSGNLGTPNPGTGAGV